MVAGNGTFDGIGMMAFDDSTGNLLVADTQNCKIKTINISQYEGSGSVADYAGSGYCGNLDGPLLSARLYYPVGLAIDSLGNIFISQPSGSNIRMLDPHMGFVSTFAGNFGSPGFIDGPGTFAFFNFPSGLAMGSNDTIYVADKLNYRIRAIGQNGLSRRGE